jgi:hypothetical protein
LSRGTFFVSSDEVQIVLGKNNKEDRNEKKLKDFRAWFVP